MPELILLGMLAIYVIVAIVVTWVIVRFVKGRTYKRYPSWIAGTTSVLLFVLLVTWDSIIEHLYMMHLCGKQAGYQVYQTITLAEDEFTGDGKPKITDSNVRLSTLTIDGRDYRYAIPGRQLINLRTFLDSPEAAGVYQTKYRLTDAQTRRLLGQFTYFTHISPLSSLFNVFPRNCPVRTLEDIDHLKKLVFIENRT